VLGLAFSPDGQFLVTAEGKGRFATVWKWGPESQEPVLTLNVPTGILRSPVFAPDGKSVVAITSATRTVSLWDVTPGQSRQRDARQFTLPGTGKLNQAIFHSDGQRLVVVSDDQVQVLNPQTGEVESIAAPHAGSIGCAVLSPDGKFLATGAGYRGRGEIRVWDLARFRKKE
jgi:WD40 repeat protein